MRIQVAIDCADPHPLAAFYADAFGYELERHDARIRTLLDQGLVTDADLVEIDVGEKTGMPFDEVKGLPEWQDDGFVAWPRGETLDQVLSRAHRVITRIAAESAGQRVLVVGHGGVTRILMSHFLGQMPDSIW